MAEISIYLPSTAVDALLTGPGDLRPGETARVVWAIRVGKALGGARGLTISASEGTETTDADTGIVGFRTILCGERKPGQRYIRLPGEGLRATAKTVLTAAADLCDRMAEAGLIAHAPGMAELSAAMK